MKKENIKANVEKGPVTGRTLQEGDGYVFASKPRFLGRHIRHSSSGGGGEPGGFGPRSVHHLVLGNICSVCVQYYVYVYSKVL